MTQISRPKFSLKDHLFNPTKIDTIALEIKEAYPEFKRQEFVQEVIEKFPELELKERIYHITICLYTYLPSDYRTAVTILLNSLPKPCDPNLTDDDFGDFIYAPYHHYVVEYGCNQHQLAFSLNALEKLTTRFSAEDAIRYFINAFPKETMCKIKEWTQHSHYHVRRLSCEGTRPTLPWSQKINRPCEEMLPILDDLFADKTRYVTRSVANHLNDISKINTDLVIHKLIVWKNTNRQHPKEMDFIIHHSLRTSIKKGNKKALELIGIKEKPTLKISTYTISKEVAMDNYFTFDIELIPQENSSLLIDYIIYFQNKRGEMKNKKVFKLKQLKATKNIPVKLHKKHLFRQFMTTRTLHAGKHLWQLQVNGDVLVEDAFELV